MESGHAGDSQEINMENQGKPSVLLVHNFYRERGGEDESVEQIEGLLKKRGHRVVPFYKNSQAISGFSFFERLLLPFRFLFAKSHELEKIITESKFDVAHIHNIFPLIPNSIYRTLQKHKIPIIQSIHNYKGMCLNGLFLLNNGKICEQCIAGNFVPGIVNRCYQKSFVKSMLIAFVMWWQRFVEGSRQKASRSLCPSRYAVEKLTSAGFPRSGLVQVPHFVANQNRPILAPSLPHYALYIGRLSEEKGVQTLLSAFENLPDLHLKIAGKGPLEREIQAQISRKGLRHVECLGFLDPEAKNRLIRGALCLIFPSECYETMGLAILEAFEAGVPVVASDLGERSYIIKDSQNGYLFKSGDSSDLRGSLRKLTAYPEKWESMRSKARKTFEEFYQEEHCYQKLSAAYTSSTANLTL